MPVDNTNKAYASNVSKWERCRDTFAGGDEVKKRRGVYLPELSGQEAKAYNAYLLRALFFGATQRTVDGLTGAILRKDPNVAIPSRLDYLKDDATSTGLSLTELSKEITKELFVTGRVGVLVERPIEAKDTKSLYFSLYHAEDIINWRFTDGKLSLVVLKETFEQQGADHYTLETGIRYRELYLDGDGYYAQRLHEKDPKSEKFVVTDIIPLERGKRLDNIQFVFGSPAGTDGRIHKPPILDLADVNLSHYRSSADLEHGRHFTALPTMYCTGVTAKDLGSGIHIGSGTALVLPPPEAKAGMIEFTGQGLGALQEALKEKEAQMAKLGARMLTTTQKGVEAAETARIHASGEESVVISVAKAVSSILTQALRLAARWEGLELKKDEGVTMNTDIIDAKMDAQTLAALLGVRQAGEISAEAFTYNLQRGELLLPDDTVETERDRLSIEAPSMED